MVDLNPRDERGAACISKATEAGSRRRRPDLSSPPSPAPAPTCPAALPYGRTTAPRIPPQTTTVNPAAVTVVRASFNALTNSPFSQVVGVAAVDGGVGGCQRESARPWAAAPREKQIIFPLFHVPIPELYTTSISPEATGETAKPSRVPLVPATAPPDVSFDKLHSNCLNWDFSISL